MSTPAPSTVTLGITISGVQVPTTQAAPGNIVATLTGSASGNTTPQTLTASAQNAAGSVSLAFSPEIPDTYTYSVQQQDVNGNAIGSPITGSVVVTAPATITIFVPTAVTATVSS